MKPFIYLSLIISCLLAACSKDELSTQKQAVAEVALHINDTIPANVSKIRFTNLSDSSYVEKQINASDIGKKDVELILDLYKLVDTMDAKVTVYYKNNTISGKKISDIVPVAGKTTKYSGDLFTTGVTVVIDPIWQSDPVYIGF